MLEDQVRAGNDQVCILEVKEHDALSGFIQTIALDTCTTRIPAQEHTTYLSDKDFTKMSANKLKNSNAQFTTVGIYYPAPDSSDILQLDKGQGLAKAIDSSKDGSTCRREKYPRRQSRRFLVSSALDPQTQPRLLQAKCSARSATLHIEKYRLLPSTPKISPLSICDDSDINEIVERYATKPTPLPTQSQAQSAGISRLRTHHISLASLPWSSPLPSTRNPYLTARNTSGPYAAGDRTAHVSSLREQIHTPRSEGYRPETSESRDVRINLFGRRMLRHRRWSSAPLDEWEEAGTLLPKVSQKHVATDSSQDQYNQVSKTSLEPREILGLNATVPPEGINTPNCDQTSHLTFTCMKNTPPVDSATLAILSQGKPPMTDSIDSQSSTAQHSDLSKLIPNILARVEHRIGVVEQGYICKGDSHHGHEHGFEELVMSTDSQMSHSSHVAVQASLPKLETQHTVVSFQSPEAGTQQPSIAKRPTVRKDHRMSQVGSDTASQLAINASSATLEQSCSEPRVADRSMSTRPNTLTSKQGHDAPRNQMNTWLVVTILSACIMSGLLRCVVRSAATLEPVKVSDAVSDVLIGIGLAVGTCVVFWIVLGECDEGSKGVCSKRVEVEV